MMDHEYAYLIVGGGMAADAAIRGIREVDANGTVGLIGAEPDPPYKRPPLSKKLWHGKPLTSIWLETDRLGVDLHLGRAARVLDLRQKCVVDDRGAAYRFDKLLLATGVSPRRLPVGGHRVIYYRTVDSYHRLRQETERGRRFAVIGGGFIGAEIAAALVDNGVGVTMIFPESAIGDRLFPSDLAGSLNAMYRERGVELIPSSIVTDLVERGERLLLRNHHVARSEMRDIEVDGVVAGIGARPNSDLARAAGLAVDDGIIVDALLRASHPDVYAAGDVASFWDAALGKRRRVEHENNATVMGRHAGRAMAGESAPYDYLPFFYSDLFDLGYEAVGDIDSRLGMAAEWDEPYRKGVVTYRRDGRVQGVLNWNIRDRLDAARASIIDADSPLSAMPQEALAMAH
jgi:NADPH-dependent 2,4-dienoyl-CoA reductase/sulfur reductase-like enzyme